MCASRLAGEAHGALDTLERALEDLSAELARAQIDANLAGNPQSLVDATVLRAAHADVCARVAALAAGVARRAPGAARPSAFAPLAAGVARRAPGAARPSAFAPPAAAAPGPSAATPALYDFGDGIQVPVMVLPPSCRLRQDVMDAIRGPMLCYVPAWEHFAVRVGDLLLHSGLGRVFPAGEKRPCAVRPCARLAAALRSAAALRAAADPRACDDCAFYHDPAKEAACGAAPGAQRVRNFLASGFAYRPRGAPAPKKGERYGTRRFGSADGLALDIASLNTDEAERFVDQVSHDVLCAAVLAWNHAGLRAAAL